MDIVFLGTGDFAVPALRALHAASQRIVAVISQPDRPAGRGRKVNPTPVRVAAEELGLPHIQTADLNGLDAAEVLGVAELGVVAAFGQKIGPAFLGALPHGCINIHGSLLPRYRGAAPYQWAIINGDETTGITIFQINERWDAGEIWTRRETAIGETETAEELHDRLAELGAAAIVEILPAIASGTQRPQPQDMSQVTRAPKLSKQDGIVDWAEPARRVARRINGLWSWPSAACTFAAADGRRERLLVARARVVDESAEPTAERPPGALLDDLTVQCHPGRVQLLEVRPAGSKLMTFDAYANGRRISPGDRLLPVEST